MRYKPHKFSSYGKIASIAIVLLMITVSFAVLYGSGTSGQNSPAAVPAATNGNSGSQALPYVSKTIDLQSNSVYAGNYAGNNYVGLTGVAYDSHNGNLYMSALAYGSVQGERSYTQGFNGSLLVVNATTMTILGHVETGLVPTFVLYDQVTNLVYVSNTENDTISVVSPVTNSLVANIPLEVYSASSKSNTSLAPLGMTVNTSSGMVYALADGDIVNISGSSIVGNPVDIFAELGYSYLLTSIQFDPSNSQLYLATPVMSISIGTSFFNSMGGVLSVNPGSMKINKAMPLGGSTDWLSYGNGNIYATGMFSSNISVISSSNHVSNITLQNDVMANYFDPVTGNLYVSTFRNNTLVSGVANASLAFCCPGTGVTQNLFTNISAVFAGQVQVVSPSTGKILHSVSESRVPFFMAFDNSGNAYVSGTLSGTLQKLSTSFALTSDQITNTPTSVLYDKSNNYVYVANSIAGQVDVYNAVTSAFVAAINTGGSPVSLTLDTQNNTVFVDNTVNQTVNVISGTHVVRNLQICCGAVGISPGGMDSGFIPFSNVYDPSNGMVYSAFQYFQNSTYCYNLPGFEIINATNDVAYIGGRAFVGLGITTTPNFVPQTMLYNPANKDVYAFGFDEANSSFAAEVINGQGSIIGTIVTNITTSLPEMSLQAAYDPMTNNVLVSFGSGYVTVNGFNATYTSLTTSTSSSYTYNVPSSIVYVSASNQIVMADFLSVTESLPNVYDTGLALVFNATTMNEIGTVQVGQGSISLAATSSGDVYVANEAYGTVSVLSPYSSSEGELTINLQTPGAAVTLDGHNIQLVNNTYTTGLLPGYYYVNASLNGYYSYSNYVYISPGSSYSLGVSLKQASDYGYLAGYVSPHDAVIEANNVIIPVVSGYFNQTLPVGTYFVATFASGYSPAVTEVNITRGHQTTMDISLSSSSSNVLITGRINPFNSNLQYSVLVNGTTTFVNSTGYFLAYVPAGSYTVSVNEQGYFPTSKTITATSDTSVYFNLTREPKETSSTANGSASATGFNSTVSNVTVANGAMTVNFTATTNGSLVLEIPYTSLKNITISELLNSKIYINGKAYTNFTVTLTSNYTVLIKVTGLSGDPTLYWVYSPSYKVPSTPSPGGLPASLMYVIYGIAAVIVVVGVVYAGTRMRKR